MTFELVNPLCEPRWNEWVSQHPGATIFHSAEWAQVLLESYGYPLHYCVLSENSRRAAGMLPVMEVASLLTGRRGVSLPFSDECAPLLSEGVTLESLVEPMCAVGKQRRWDYLELRGDAASLPHAKPSDEFAVHYLALEANEELQYKKVKDTHRRNIQKARRESIEIHRLQTRDAMDAYYALHCLTRQRQGLPPQPRGFFHIIQERVIAAGLGSIFLARFHGQWIAGAVYFHFGGRAVYKFGASNLAFQHLRANNVLMWEAICHYRRTGARELSFGRTDLHNHGLLQFKRGWGADEVSLRYFRVGLGKPLYPRMMDRDHGTGSVSRILQRMPVQVLRLLGVLAYRHMG
ncbi:MAG: GNAT family N-acetyltransferase [Bryobacterales bacterium]|nr:GNAT family N-acetyltransferase [Bryobacterales bacterium]